MESLTISICDRGDQNRYCNPNWPQVCVTKLQQGLKPEETDSSCPEHLQQVMFTVQHADVYWCLHICMDTTYCL